MNLSTDRHCRRRRPLWVTKANFATEPCVGVAMSHHRMKTFHVSRVVGRRTNVLSEQPFAFSSGMLNQSIVLNKRNTKHALSNVNKACTFLMSS